MTDLLDQVRSGAAGLSAETRRRVAVHECGHVIVSKVLGAGELLGVSINEQGGAAQFESHLDGAATADRIECHIATTLAGRVAEKILLGDISIGSVSDLSRATRMAQSLETDYGLGAFGPVFLGDGPFESPASNPKLLVAVRARLEAAEMRAATILSEHQTGLETLAEELGRRGYLGPEDIDAIIDNVSGLVEALGEAAE